MKRYIKKLVSICLVLFLALGAFAPKTVQASTVRLSMTSMELYTGYSKQLTLKNATDVVRWSTSNKAVAKVSSNGIVTGVDKGTCIIYAYDKATQKNYSCKVTVKRKSFTLSITKPESMFFHFGGGSFSYTTLKNYIKTTLGDSIAADVEWESSDKSIVYVVDNQGLRAADYGEVVLTAKMRGKTYIYDLKIVEPEEEKDEDKDKDKESKDSKESK